MKPLAIRSHRQQRQRRTVVGLIVLAAVVIAGLVVLFTSVLPSKAKPPSAKSATSPPTLVGVVSLIGTGSSEGDATTTALVDLAGKSTAKQNDIKVGTFPDAVAIAPNQKTAYVTDYVTDAVTPIDLLTGKAEHSIPAGNGPADIAIAPNGKTAYVTDAGYDSIGDTVTPINLRTDKPLRRITVGKGPQGIAITPDGTMAYVANAGAFVAGQPGNAIGHTVTPINLRTGRALPPIGVGNLPLAIAVSSDGSTVFVTNSDSGSVSSISIAANITGTPIQVSGAPQAIAADGSQMLVADAVGSGDGNVTPISVAGLSAGTPITVPDGPSAIVVAPGNKTAWVVANSAGTLVAINTKSGVVDTAHAISVADGPYALGLAEIPSNDVQTIFGVHEKKKVSAKKS